MAEHSTLPFSQLHVAKFDQGTDAAKGSPSGVGDAYYASDTNVLYIADAAGTAWVASDLNKINTTGDLVLGQNSILVTELASDPSTPATGKWKVYAKAGGLYYVDDAGAVTGPLGSGGGGGFTKYAKINTGTCNSGASPSSGVEYQVINFTQEMEVGANFFDAGSDDDIFTIPSGEDGDYLVGFRINMNDTGYDAAWQCRMKKNTTTILTHTHEMEVSLNASYDDNTMTASTFITLAATDTLKLYCVAWASMSAAALDWDTGEMWLARIA